MKKILLVLSLMMACFVNTNAKGTYRGFFDAGPTIGEGLGISTSTTHGYQFNKNWFLGAGLGYLYNNNDDDTIGLPIFINVRYDRLSEKVWTFYAEYSVGYNVAYGSDDAIFMSATTGVRKRLAERFGLNFGVGFTVANCKYNTAGGLCLKIGIDF